MHYCRGFCLIFSPVLGLCLPLKSRWHGSQEEQIQLDSVGLRHYKMFIFYLYFSFNYFIILKQLIINIYSGHRRLAIPWRAQNLEDPL